MFLKQGKNYESIRCTDHDFIVGKEYLAITSHQLLNEYSFPFDVGEWPQETFERYFKLKENETKENVSHPQHYNKGGIECFDVIKAFYGEQGFEGFCVGNVMKYIMRYAHKGNALEDLKKASFYLNEVIKLYENNE